MQKKYCRLMCANFENSWKHLKNSRILEKVSEEFENYQK